MGDKTSIEWTDATWNPIRGVKGRHTCVKVSPGCTHCYAERLNVRFGGPRYVIGADEMRLDEEALTLPLRWRKPRRIFTCSMTDLFEERVPDDWIDQIHGVMALARHHTFQVLTKRATRMAAWWLAKKPPQPVRISKNEPDLSNLWCGVSVETPAYYARIEELRRVPARVRFLSLEPLLAAMPDLPLEGISWVIVGGESCGPPERALVTKNAPELPPAPDGLDDWENLSAHVAHGPWWIKPEALTWVREIRDQCVAAGVPFFLKQFGGPIPKSGGRLLDGKEWNEYPS